MHWYWVDTLSIGFGLTLGKLIFKRFVSLRKNKGCSFYNVCRSTLKWTGFCSNLSPHPHVILHAGLARSCRIHCFNKRRKTFSLEKRYPPNGWGVGESFFVWLSPTFVCDGPPSPRGRGLSIGWWILRLRLRLRAEWQGRRQTAKCESFQTRETDQKKICCHEHWV